jgi:hypothetical protein
MPDDGIHRVQKHVEVDFVHLLCIYSSACEVGFMSWFVHYAWYTQN